MVIFSNLAFSVELELPFVVSLLACILFIKLFSIVNMPIINPRCVRQEYISAFSFES